MSKVGSRPSAIVGIGASAGGLEAFTEFLRHLPTDTGMGFVLVQHLDPSHQSILPELLSKTTRRRVTSVEDGMPVLPNEVYVIPPNRSMTIAKGVLHLGPREGHGHRLVDEFFRSLGKDQKNHGIGVVLSGTASDGTIGLESIKAEGGITFAQDASAKYDGMPRSAIAAGHADFVLPPARIAEEIARIGRHPYVRPTAQKRSSDTYPVESKLSGERTREVPGFDPFKEADRILVTKYTPASVLVDGRMEIMQVRGSTSVYLEAPTGKATHNVLKMAREGLMLPLREALNQAKKEDRRVQTPGIWVKHNGHSREIRLDVVPISGASPDDHYFLILFRPALLSADSVPPGRTPKKTGHQSKQLDERRLADLQRQFQAGREYSQSFLEQQEAYTEELQSANEEIQSSNEELQSINEELETAKEELESSNEELTTINEKLQNRNRETHQLNTDLTNLLTNVRIPILMIDADLCLRRFTPAAAKTLNLVDTDVGRPISELKLLEIPGLSEMVAQVLDKVNALERELRDSKGHWYKLYVGPYTAPENKIDGVVVVLTDIHVLKQTEEVIQASRDYAEAIVETVRQPLVILNADLRVKTANAFFYATFHVSPADTENQLIFDLGNKQWDRPELRRLLQEILPRDNQFQHFEVYHAFPSIGLRTVLLNARKLRLQNQDPMILMTIEDITERKQAVEESLRESEERFQIAADTAPVMIWMSGLDKRCAFFNKPWLEFTGRTMEEELGDGWTEGVHPEDYNRCREVYVTSFEAHEPFKMEYRLRRHDGEYRWLLDHGIPRFSSSGAFLGYIGSCIDITERIEIEEALRASVLRFRTMVSAIPSPTYEGDPDGNNTFASDQWFAYTGMTAEETAGRGFTRAFHPDDAENGRARYEAAVRSGTLFESRLRIRAADGSYRWFLNRAQPGRDAEGRIVRWAGSLTDIDDLIRAEERLRESELRFRTMISAVPSLTFEADADGNNNFVSDQWFAYTGMTAKETAGGGFIRAYHPDEAEDVLRQWNAAVRSGMSFESKCRIRAVDGSYRWFLNRAQPGRDAEGRIVRWAGSLTDIEDLIRIEQALRESKERLAGIVSTAMDAIITVDEDHRIVLFNEAAERMFGCMAAKALGQTIERFIPECFRHAHPRRSGETGGASRATSRHRSLTALRTDGTEFPIEAAISQIEVGGRKLYTVIHRDITERKQAEKEREELAREQAARAAAEDANRSKDEFLALVSHELRTPLTPILGYTRMLAAGSVDRAAIGNMAAIVERNAKAQLQIIEDLLDSGRITTGKLRINWAVVDLAPVLEAALDTVRPAAEAKGVTLEADFGSMSEQVLGDSTRMQQVVWNLLANSVKFTAKGGRVELRMESDADNVRIRVSDTGKGIEPEFLPFVFDRFRQADSTSTRRYGGLGLGLSIVKHLVEAHGGTILAASEGEGRGATFTVTLPRRQLDFIEPPAPAVAPREVSTESSITAYQAVSLEGVRVLVVDDQEDARNLLIHTLSEYGAQVTAMSSGAEALSFLSNLTVGRRPHVLILDIAMPDEDGYSVLKKVRALEAMQGAAADAIPAIALTAYGRSEDRLRALQAGFQMHVAKPVEPVELAVVIERLTTRRAWERERVG